MTKKLNHGKHDQDLNPHPRTVRHALAPLISIEVTKCLLQSSNWRMSNSKNDLISHIEVSLFALEVRETRTNNSIGWTAVVAQW